MEKGIQNTIIIFAGDIGCELYWRKIWFSIKFQYIVLKRNTYNFVLKITLRSPYSSTLVHNASALCYVYFLLDHFLYKFDR